ncbi:COG4695 Phage-related protein [uncultured Caudovirales phage]|uniref:COG4695 Phage-related protein n=1 Tax=uncultured Caudovirales phage TaxID=2100421 RepID=A0A6J5MRP4_9CAUD|nr:COG4695 Phage-related protein [uncultured Caudovirales phage]
MAFRDRLISRLGYEVEPMFVPDTENRGVANTAPVRDSVSVTPTTALSLVAVSRATSVLETAIMQIPVNVYRGNTALPTPLWLETPDLDNQISQAEWLGTTLIHMATYGNAFWYVQRGPRGIVNIRNLHPQDVSVSTDNTGRLIYSYGNKNYTSQDIKHLKLWSNPSSVSLLGEGPLQRHRSVLRSALDLHNYADNWFRTAAVPTGTLTTSEFLSADVARQNKEAFVASQQERSIAVLSSGLKYDSITLSPEQAQFLENQKFITRQIAMMFGVPTMYLGMGIEGQGMTYVNGNEDRAKLFEDGLQQYIVRIQQAITDLLPRGQYAEFNLTEFLRPNVKTRYESYAIGLTNNFLTVPEVREMEGMSEIIESLPDTPQDQGPVDVLDNQPMA